MKNNRIFIFLWILLILGAFLKFSTFPSSPIEIFLLRGSDNTVEAFRLRLFLDRERPTVTALALSAEQKKTGQELLKGKNGKKLSEFSKTLGGSGAVIGVLSAEEAWPGFLGGGWKGFFGGEPADTYGNLQWTDRLFLALRSKSPPPAPFETSENPADDKTPSSSFPVKANDNTEAVPTAVIHTGALRVEILNGCGIKGAADWAARRLSGDGIIIADTGNAENFHFSTTVVKTSAGIPISLEEAVERLGLTKDSIEDSASPSASVDVVVIIGRDYRKLKERVRGRNQH